MKNRNIPFGYQYKNGIIILHPAESEIVRHIITDYLSGASMLTIATNLNQKSIEYMPGVIGWNKARIKRLIEDERYLGTENFPSIVDGKTFEQIQQIRTERNTQKHIDRTIGAYQLNVPVLCECGKIMSRIHDSRCKWGEKWLCECGTVIKISDTSLLNTIVDRMNNIIGQAEIIKKPKKQTAEPSSELLRTENEIARTLEGIHFNKEDLKKKIFECATLRYTTLDAADTSERLKADFEKSGSLSTFNKELLDRTTTGVILHPDKAVSLILKNGQKIGKELLYATDSTENSARNSTDTEHSERYARHTISAESGCCLLPCVNQ